MSALPTKRDISWSVQMWLPQILLLRPSAIGPMESARYQGYEQRGASSAFQRVIWNIKRQNIFVCFSNVIHVTIHGTSLTCDLRLRCSRRCARLGYRCQSIKFCAFGTKNCFDQPKGLGDNVASHSKRSAIHVRFGSKADIAASPINVRFTPKSRHRLSACRNWVGPLITAR